MMLLTLFAVVVGYYPPGLTQGAPGSFICDRTLYVSRGTPNTTLSSVITTPSFALNDIGTANKEYNAIGFNVRDGFIYGIAPDSNNTDSNGTNPPGIYRINSAGQATLIGFPTGGLPPFPVLPGPAAGDPRNAFAGDIDRNGIYFVYITVSNPAPAGQPNLFAINLTTNAVIRSFTLPGTNFADIAFNPVDDQLYAFDNTLKQMARIDPTTGTVTYFGNQITNLGNGTAVGASFFDAFGNFYAYESNGTTIGNVYVARNLTTANPIVFQTLNPNPIQSVSRFDGAACAYAPIVEKIVDPLSVPANGIVTYRYRLANQLGQPLSTANLSFTDQLPAGLTYVNQTLNNTSVGGTPNAYGGSPLLQITNITIPARGSVEISVNVRVRATTAPVPILNQATINNVPSLPGLTIPTTIKSDFPNTGIYPDSTPLQITPTPLIGVGKRVGLVENLGSGNFRVTYLFVVSNAGNVNLSNVQVTENLSTTFGTTPFQVTSVTSPNGDLTPNPAYNGRTDTNLLAGTGNTLALGESKTIQLVMTLTPGANLGPYNNQAQATGQGPDGRQVSDLSQNGVNLDPDGDGDPTNNNDPTQVNLGENPVLGVAKLASSLVNVGGGNVTVTYSILVRNYGDVPLSNVQVLENLSTTFGTTPFTVNRVTSPPGNLTPNPNYNGRDNINLLSGTDTLALGQTKTFDVVVTITPGNDRRTFTNQVEGTATSPTGKSVRDQSQAGINPDPDNDGNPTNNNDPTPFTIGPNLRLVKRITNATRGGVPVSGVNFASFVNDPNDVNDDATGWSQLPGGILSGVYRIGSDNPLQSGDEVEYTVYFLSDGSQPVTDAKVCDPIPEKTTFIPDSFQLGQGILLNQQATNTFLTNAQDTDQGTFFARLTPVTSPCLNTNNSNGSILVNLGELPFSAPNNVGFTRFRVRID
jgi:uncharacterized repeat protein (TIGR01451 family)